MICLGWKGGNNWDWRQVEAASPPPRSGLPTGSRSPRLGLGNEETSPETKGEKKSRTVSWRLVPVHLNVL